jgi:hypothetical protein
MSALLQCWFSQDQSLNARRDPVGGKQVLVFLKKHQARPVKP